MTPIILMNSILLVITVLLSLADRVLVNYGECKVTVREGDEKKDFTVEGGGFLLNSLTDNNISITSSCGGKASCGYCKVRVLHGGGQILPTEEIFMDRNEIAASMRLACQVKVKEDLTIDIPDYLETVRSIVKNKSFDPKLRWEFTRADTDLHPDRKLLTKLDKNDRELLSGILKDYKDKKVVLIPVLQAVSAHYNYLPEKAMWYVSKELDIPLSMVFRVATFYNNFSLTPKGKHIIRVCIGTACYVKGGPKLLDAVKRGLKIDVDQVTSDSKFSLETVSCLGCCGQAPVITVDDDIYGYMNQTQIEGILKKYE